MNIYVFETSSSGRHTLPGAAYAVANLGAIHGQSSGLQGNSYAIPVIDSYDRVLPLAAISKSIHRMISFANVQALRKKPVALMLPKFEVVTAEYGQGAVARILWRIEWYGGLVLPADFR